jgi:hypothetical protein
LPLIPGDEEPITILYGEDPILLMDVSFAPFTLYLIVQGAVPVKATVIFVVEVPSLQKEELELVMVTVGKLSTPMVNL